MAQVHKTSLALILPRYTRRSQQLSDGFTKMTIAVQTTSLALKHIAPFLTEEWIKNGGTTKGA